MFAVLSNLCEMGEYVASHNILCQPAGLKAELCKVSQA